MRRKLTPEEKVMRQILSQEKSFPRWKHSSTGSFLYYYRHNHWSEEVSPNPDGTWSVGQEREGTLRHYHSLRDALQYGERLVTAKARCRGQSPLQRGRDAAVEEKLRRDGIMLDF
jgi:hypothetical protein